MAPPGAKAKAQANLAALRVLRAIESQRRPANLEEQAVLARWAGWGALPGVFDENAPAWSDVRGQLRSLLDEDAWAKARRTTINAHYTSAEVARSIWNAAVALGFSGGRVLEPGCGSGTFIGLAPDGMAVKFVGVELDPTTAAIAAALYPEADIRSEGFEATRLPSGSFDLTLGNVPFGKVVLQADNPGRYSIHNQFIVKSLRLTRPGGFVAVITSRYTLDARNPAARREMAEMADLVGAVRLPAGAFRAASGTEAITDILLLRRREEGAVPRAEQWAQVSLVEAVNGEVEVNEWYARHPELVLGELRAGRGHYREDDLSVVAHTTPLAPALSAVLSRLAEQGVAAGLGWLPALRPTGALQAVVPAPSLPAGNKEGSILATREGGFVRVTDGASQRFEPSPRSDRTEMIALIGIRDALNDVLKAQAGSRNDDAFATAQSDLNQRYDSYVARFGPLNRFSVVLTGRTDAVTGEPTFRRLRPRMGGFRRDPDFPAILALEVFDPETQTAVKAPVFNSRVVAPRVPRLGADSAVDALAICLDEHGQVDLSVVADLLGLPGERAREELGTLVWDDPVTGDLVPSATYLSGDVRRKLAEAEAAAATDPARYDGHVEALQAVLPVDLGPEDIDARLGAAWIPPTDIEEFARELFAGSGVIVDHAPATATWAVQLPVHERRSVAATSAWGTARADAAAILQCSLNQQAVTVYDVQDDGSRVLNAAETLAAREKQDAMETRFSSWVWQGPGRSERLAARYNELFNSAVLPRHDGSHLTLPGLSYAFAPHAHQRDAVWRVLQEPTVLLAHAVGAGKTATMVMAGMELRRLGLARKPAYVVPNHMLDQFAREFLQLYPQARVLVATREDTTPVARKHFVARCATGEWDAVVITVSAFERIPVSLETRRAFIERRMRELREAVSESRGLTVKRLELHMARLEERHKRLLAEGRKDDGVNFESTGIDYLFADEAHAYKNRQFATRIQGAGGEGSQRAEDMELKLEYLRSRHGDRVATFATATPIANSLSEMYVMQAYLQPEALRRAGVQQFDAWAATFGRTVSSLELAPDGATYRLTSRFARFRNVPELLTMFRSVADVRTPDQLALPVPAISGGRPETVVAPPSEELLAYVRGLADRAEQVRNRVVRPEEDNMLKISGDGRKAALDLRLVGEAPDPTGGKVAVAAERIASIFRATRDLPFREPTGRLSPRPGGFQLVFCDLGTPKGDLAWSVYADLRGRLVRLGVPEGGVRFIHEAADDRAKAELFAACREGRVAVLIGSTEKMGVGTNIQARLVALHHLDCPWRPADIEQREGRALRQGNQNSEVAIIRYVTEGSFDVFMWQTVERKAAFIHQVMRGSLVGREVDDIGEQALSFAEVKALATGNPLLMEKASVDNEVARLTRLRRAHHEDQARLARVLAAAAATEARLEGIVRQCDDAIARRLDTRGDRFTMTVDGVRFDSRGDAGRQLLGSVAVGKSARDVAELAGFAVDVRWEHDVLGETVHLELRDAPVRLSLTKEDARAADPAGLVQRLEHRVRGLDDSRADAQQDLDRIRGEAHLAKSRLGASFEYAQRLETLLSRQGELAHVLSPERAETSSGLPQYLAGAAITGMEGPGLDVDM